MDGSGRDYVLVYHVVPYQMEKTEDRWFPSSIQDPWLGLALVSDFGWPSQHDGNSLATQRAEQPIFNGMVPWISYAKRAYGSLTEETREGK